MHRREALLRVAALMGSTLSAPTLAALVTACDSRSDKKEATNGKFSPELEKVLDEATETIIPTTSTPGAKAAGVGPWIVMMMNECYPENARVHFTEGLSNLDNMAQDTYKKSFVECGANERTELMKKVEAEAFVAREKRMAEADKDKDNVEQPLPHYFFTLKELTLLGYFTSEPGATQALEYVPIPGRYEGCMDMKPGQKVWA